MERCHRCGTIKQQQGKIFGCWKAKFGRFRENPQRAILNHWNLWNHDKVMTKTRHGLWNCCVHRQLRTWIHDNHCDTTIKSDTGQHSWFLRRLSCSMLMLFIWYHHTVMNWSWLWWWSSSPKIDLHHVGVHLVSWSKAVVAAKAPLLLCPLMFMFLMLIFLEKSKICVSL